MMFRTKHKGHTRIDGRWKFCKMIKMHNTISQGSSLCKDVVAAAAEFRPFVLSERQV